MTRRRMLQGTAALAATAAMPRVVEARTALRRDLLRLPGVGRTVTPAHWRRVGGLCLSDTRATVRPGAFRGVDLTFLALRSERLHGDLFRGLLAPWEDYTGARIAWIELTHSGHAAALARAFAAGTAEFDLLEMAATDEGELLGRGMASAMPHWARALVEPEDYLRSQQPPVGTWDGRPYRVACDAECHLFHRRAHRYASPQLRQAWAGRHGTPWRPPTSWDEVDAQTRFLAGRGEVGHLDPLKGWGGHGFAFLADRAAAYAKRPGQPVFLFDPGTMAPLVDSPPWGRAIRDVAATIPSLPPGQIDADPGTVAFQQFLAGTGTSLAWWGDVAAATLRRGAPAPVVEFDVLPGAREVWNPAAERWEAGLNVAPTTPGIGWGLYVMARTEGDALRHRAAWSAAAHLGGRDLSLWCAVYPSGFQPYRTSHLDAREWVEAGHPQRIGGYLAALGATCGHPNVAVEPRIPGLLRYYALAEVELSRIYAGRRGVQEGAAAIAASWEALTDTLGRERQLALYRASLGLDPAA